MLASVLFLLFAIIGFSLKIHCHPSGQFLMIALMTWVARVHQTLLEMYVHAPIHLVVLCDVNVAGGPGETSPTHR